MNFKRRLDALERKLVCEPATLFFEDGSSVEIRGRADFILNLFNAAIRGVHSHEADLIRRSVRSEEPGGAHLIDVVRAVLQGPGTRSCSTNCVEGAS
jgi:hypothetical protein